MRGQRFASQVVMGFMKDERVHGGGLSGFAVVLEVVEFAFGLVEFLEEQAGFEHTLNSLAKDGPVDGFGDEIRCADGEGPFDGFKVGEGGDHQHGGAVFAVEGVEGFAAGEAVHFGHDGVEQNQVRRGIDRRGWLLRCDSLRAAWRRPGGGAVRVRRPRSKWWIGRDLED